jgi:hypothetical protein
MKVQKPFSKANPSLGSVVTHKKSCSSMSFKYIQDSAVFHRLMLHHHPKLHSYNITYEHFKIKLKR